MYFAALVSLLGSVCGIPLLAAAGIAFLLLVVRAVFIRRR